MMLAWSIVLLPGVTLGLTALNLATWRRGETGARFPGSVSVLIPARNEAPRIATCLASIQASRHPVGEILVYDDESTDDTRAIVLEHASRDPRIRIIESEPLPPGWVGKAHACDRLGRAASGDMHLYVDADVVLTETAIERVASIFASPRCSVVTAVPAQRTVTFVERLMMPLLMLTYVSWLPLELVLRTRDPRVVAANGQILAVRGEDARRLGYFQGVAHEVVDDVAYCRAAKRAGLRVAFVDGAEMARCRMYESGASLWDGFSKNIAEGVGGPFGLVIALSLYIGAFLLPWLVLGSLLGGASGSTALLYASSAGVGANLLQRSALAARYRQSMWGVALHPVAIIGFIALSLRSLWWTLRGELRWSGRAYAGRAARRRASA